MISRVIWAFRGHANLLWIVSINLIGALMYWDGIRSLRWPKVIFYLWYFLPINQVKTFILAFGKTDKKRRKCKNGQEETYNKLLRKKVKWDLPQNQQHSLSIMIEGRPKYRLGLMQKDPKFQFRSREEAADWKWGKPNLLRIEMATRSQSADPKFCPPSRI